MALNHKLLLDKTVEAIKATNLSVKAPDSTIRDLVKSFTTEALQGVLKSISVYGTNTHVYATVQEFVINFKRECQ